MSELYITYAEIMYFLDLSYHLITFHALAILIILLTNSLINI